MLVNLVGTKHACATYLSVLVHLVYERSKHANWKEKEVVQSLDSNEVYLSQSPFGVQV